MKISGEHLLPAAQEQVWALLDDPARLARLVPGVQKFNIVAPDEFEGTMTVAVAAVKGTYTGHIKIDEKRQPEYYKASFDGKGAQGFIRGTGTLELEPKGQEQTLVRYAADVQIGGPIMQVGQRMLESVAKRMLNDFFAAAETELKGGTNQS